MGYTEDDFKPQNNQNTQNVQHMFQPSQPQNVPPQHQNVQFAPPQNPFMQQQQQPVQEKINEIEQVEKKYKQIIKAMQATIDELKNDLSSHKVLIQYQNEKIKQLEKDNDGLQHQITGFVKQMTKEEPVKPNYNPVLARPNSFNQPSQPKPNMKPHPPPVVPEYRLLSIQEQVMKYIQEFSDHLDRINLNMSQKKFSKIKYKILNLYIPTPQALETGLSFIIQKVTSDGNYAERLSELTRDLTTHSNPRFPDFMKKSLSTQIQECFDTHFRMGQKTGIIPFIIECYNKHLLSTSFIHNILTLLLLERGTPSEFDIQVIYQILTSGIGRKLDADVLSKNFVSFFYGQMNQLYVNQFLSSKHKEILKEMLDLRLNYWVPKGKDSEGWQFV